MSAWRNLKWWNNINKPETEMGWVGKRSMLNLKKCINWCTAPQQKLLKTSNQMLVFCLLSFIIRVGATSIYASFQVHLPCYHWWGSAALQLRSTQMRQSSGWIQTCPLTTCNPAVETWWKAWPWREALCEFWYCRTPPLKKDKHMISFPSVKLC